MQKAGGMEQQKMTEEKAFDIIISSIESAINWSDYVDNSEPDCHRLNVINTLEEALKEIKLIRDERCPNKQENVPNEV